MPKPYTIHTPFSEKPEDSTEIYPGLTCEWYCNRQIIAYRPSYILPALIDAWTEHVIRVVSEWPREMPYLALHDLSRPGVALQFGAMMKFDIHNIGITPAAREHVENLVGSEHDYYVRVAVNLNLTMSGKINSLLATRANTSEQIEYRTFYNQRHSLAWLAGILQKPLATSRTGTLRF